MNTMNLTVADLKQIVILSHLTDAMLEMLLETIDVLRFDHEDTIFQQNDPAHRFYMLRRGNVLLEQRITDKVTACIGSIKPGFSFGWSSMIEGGLYTARAVCVEPCEILSFTKQRIDKLLKQNPEMGFRLYQRLLVILKKRFDYRSEQLRLAIVNHPDMQDLFNEK